MHAEHIKSFLVDRLISQNLSRASIVKWHFSKIQLNLNLLLRMSNLRVSQGVLVKIDVS